MDIGKIMEKKIMWNNQTINIGDELQCIKFSPYHTMGKIYKITNIRIHVVDIIDDNSISSTEYIHNDMNWGVVHDLSVSRRVWEHFIPVKECIL